MGNPHLLNVVDLLNDGANLWHYDYQVRTGH